MRVLVVYHSVTGNTEKIAKSIYEEIQSKHQTDLMIVRDANFEILHGYDLVIVGAPCHDSDLSVPIKKFLEGFPPSPSFKLAGFFTHATYTPDGSERTQELFEKWASKCSQTFERISKTKQVDFLGYFNCMGAPSPPIEAFIRREIITTDEEWNEYLPKVKTHPNDEDIGNAKKFAIDIINRM